MFVHGLTRARRCEQNRSIERQKGRHIVDTDLIQHIFSFLIMSTHISHCFLNT